MKVNTPADSCIYPKIRLSGHNAKKCLRKPSEDQGQQLIGWRDVPCDGSILGSFSKPCEPVIRQVFIAKGDNVDGELDFERKLYIIRREVTNKVNYLGIDPKGFFYVASLSSRVLGYKGMLTTTQMIDYFADLSHPAMETSMALVHSRFSTNTFPNWPRAQPFRYMSHNGKSTPSAAMSIPCSRARACSKASFSEMTSKRFCPSSVRTAAIRPCLTIAWNFLS
jgi:glutamate synthase domain-containing protein 1